MIAPVSMARLAWLATVAACGRVGFSAQADGGADAVAATDGPAAKIAWMGSFAQIGAATVASFQFTPHAAGNALVLHVECNYPTAPTVTVSSPTVTFVPLSALFGSTTTNLWAASYGAIATGEVSTQVNLTWSVICGAQVVLGDEFANTDPTGGAVTFDNHAEAQASTGDCTGTAVTRNADDAVWAACTAGADITGVSAGYTKAGDDAAGDWSAYKVTTDPAGTAETPTFTGAAGYVLTLVTIKPRG